MRSGSKFDNNCRGVLGEERRFLSCNGPLIGCLCYWERDETTTTTKLEVTSKAEELCLA